MKLLWATRGRSWGFRFLLNGNIDDPLARYEDAFLASEGDRSFRRMVGTDLAVRMEDPERRADESGRVIPHDFLLIDEGGGLSVASFDEDALWSSVADTYAAVWERSAPPTRQDLMDLLGESFPL